MNEEILNCIFKCKDTNFTVYSNFLTPNIYRNLGDKYEDIKIYSFGKIRKIFAFCPQYLEEIENFPISLLKISIKNKFRNYTNKDFLGSIMGLNIRRELIGDMFVKDNICYVYVLDNIKDFILQNLNKVGVNNIEIEIEDINKELDFEYEILNLNVASLRFDNIVAAITNFSRNETKKYIELGLCMIDYEVVLNTNKLVKYDSVISIKKFGKFILKETTSISKKGKQKIKILKFI